MAGYRRSLSQRLPDPLHYHFVFSTKYRKPVLRGEVGIEVRDLIRQICRSKEIEIVSGHVRPDHVRLLLNVPPDLAPSKVMQAIKGTTSHHMLMNSRRLRAAFWGRPVGAWVFCGNERKRDR